jgi:hypothetical protein
MRRVAGVIGLILLALGALILAQAWRVLPGAMLHGRSALGWGAWGLAFGAAFLVWSRGAPSKS